jgi:hypothetical protein
MWCASAAAAAADGGLMHVHAFARRDKLSDDAASATMRELASSSDAFALHFGGALAQLLKNRCATPLRTVMPI